MLIVDWGILVEGSFKKLFKVTAYQIQGVMSFLCRQIGVSPKRVFCSKNSSWLLGVVFKAKNAMLNLNRIINISLLSYQKMVYYRKWIHQNPESTIDAFRGWTTFKSENRCIGNRKNKTNLLRTKYTVAKCSEPVEF